MKILENNANHSRVSSIIIFFHYPCESWDAGTARHFQLGSSFIKLRCTDPWYCTDDIRCLTLISFLVCTQPNRVLSNNTSWYINSMSTQHLPPAYSTQMAGQYGQTLEDYVFDLEFLSYECYSEGMRFLILSFLEQRPKPLQVIVVTLMLYDFIYHIPQQVRLSTCKESSTYLLSPRFSTSIGMFPIQWPTISTDMFEFRRKWSKSHVIYFSILIINWTGMMLVSPLALSDEKTDQNFQNTYI